MKNKVYLVAVALMCLLAACGDDDEKETQITISSSQQLNQTAFADDEDTGAGFTFTAKTTWSTNISETTSSLKSTSSNSTSWVKLYNDGQETYSGKAGTFNLTIVLNPNYTGDKRTAKIDIICGNDKITITVTQEAKTEDGKVPEDPDPQPEPDAGYIRDYDIDDLFQDFSGDASHTGTFTFTATGDWTSQLSLTTSEDGDNYWFTYSPIAGGAGRHTINFSMTANNWSADRTAHIYLMTPKDTVMVSIRQETEDDPVSKLISTGNLALDAELIKIYDRDSNGALSEYEAGFIEVIDFPYQSGDKFYGPVAFFDFPNLTSINLKGHAITGIKLGAPKLKELNLANNDLDGLGYVEDKVSALELINFSGNKNLKDASFNFPALKILDVSDCDIYKIYTGGYPKLEKLSISNNPEMYSIDISDNHYISFMNCRNAPKMGKESLVISEAQRKVYEANGSAFIMKDDQTTFLVYNN